MGLFSSEAFWLGLGARQNRQVIKTLFGPELVTAAMSFLDFHFLSKQEDPKPLSTLQNHERPVASFKLCIARIVVVLSDSQLVCGQTLWRVLGERLHMEREITAARFHLAFFHKSQCVKFQISIYAVARIIRNQRTL